MRKILTISAIGLALLWVMGFVYCGKHCVKIIGWTWSYSSEKAGKFGCEGITLNFDKEGRLFEATFKLKEGNKLDIEGLSLKAGDSPDSLEKLLGQPLRSREYSLRMGNEVRYLVLSFPYSNGFLTADFELNADGKPRLSSVSFEGKAEKLPGGLKLGVQREDVAKAYGQPDVVNARKQAPGSLNLYRFLLVLLPLWHATLFYYPRKRKPLTSVASFLLNWLIACIIFAGWLLLSYFAINLFEKGEAYPLHNVARIFLNEDGSLTPAFPLTFVGGFFITCLLFWWSYYPFAKPIQKGIISALIIYLFSILYSFIPLRYFSFYYPYLSSTLIQDSLSPSLPIFLYGFFIILWSYILNLKSANLAHSKNAIAP